MNEPFGREEKRSYMHWYRAQQVAMQMVLVKAWSFELLPCTKEALLCTVAAESVIEATNMLFEASHITFFHGRDGRIRRNLAAETSGRRMGMHCPHSFPQWC